MGTQGIRIEERDGVVYLTGVLDEYADLTELETAKEPLLLNMAGVSRLNSIGIRNLLRFLNAWGDKPFKYIECTSEFVDQLNMIPGLLGKKGHGLVQSLKVPYDCPKCEHEQEFLCDIREIKEEDGVPVPPAQTCPNCGKPDMQVLNDSFFIFLDR